MYIYPNMELKLLRNVYLNNDYDHTIFFSSLSAQTAYFTNSSKVKYTLNNQQYQRKERGWIQVNLNQNDLWDCTYLMYKNSSYNQKWFYAFILSVEYVNDNVSRINFEIDVLQTWNFNYTLDKCFVEREHSETDVIGENTVEEGLDLGPEYHIQAVSAYDLDCTRVCIVETGRWNQTTDKFVPYDPSIHLNYFTGARFVSFDLKDSTSTAILLAHLNDYIEHGVEDSIICIYQYPRFMGEMPLASGTIDNYGYSEVDYTFSPNRLQIDGYIPKNKKLFTYPYNFIEVDNGLGESAPFKMELWDTSHLCEFKIYGSPYGIPSCACMPRYYNGETNSIQNAIINKINVQSAWTGDSYQVWLARNEKNVNLNTLRSIGGIIGGLAGTIGGIAGQNYMYATGAASLMIGSARALVDNILNKIERKNETEATPAPARGQIANDMLNLQSDLNRYSFRQKTVRKEYAKIIDEYFSRFGYASHRIKVPNRNSRQNWTYTKTVGCEITGNIPSDDLVKIKYIYDKGITFWNNGDNVGNYGDFTNPIYS